MKAEVAVALVAWDAAEHHGGVLGSHADVVERVAQIQAAGVEIPDLVVHTGSGRLRSPDVSQLLDRLKGRGVLKRLTVPLQLTPWGGEKLGRELRHTVRRSPALAGEMRTALNALGVAPAPLRERSGRSRAGR